MRDSESVGIIINVRVMGRIALVLGNELRTLLMQAGFTKAWHHGPLPPGFHMDSLSFDLKLILCIC